MATILDLWFALGGLLGAGFLSFGGWLCVQYILEGGNRPMRRADAAQQSVEAWPVRYV